MGDYVDEHGVGRNYTARELMAMRKNETTVAARLRREHLHAPAEPEVGVPRDYCAACNAHWPCDTIAALDCADAMARALTDLDRLLDEGHECAAVADDGMARTDPKDCYRCHLDDALSLARACGLGGDDGE